MKLKFLFVLSVLVFALHSCSKDEPKVETNNPPLLEDTTLAIPENAASGTVLITLATKDEDGDALGYAIEGDPGPFNLSNIGVLTLSGELDYDETKTYTITINAYDSKSSASATFTINVTKVEPENQAPIIENQGSAASELSTSEAVLHDVEAEDPEGSPLAFEITANDNNLFVINELGEIRLAEGKNLDFETQESHQITVTVSDGINTAEAVVTLTVENVIESLFEDPEAFILTFETTQADEEIQVGVDPDLSYDYTIDWGDGTIDEITLSMAPAHAFATPGEHTVAIKGDQFPRIVMYNTPSADKLKSIEQWGATEWTSFNSAFRECTNLTYNATDAPNLTNVTDLRYMFLGASSFDGNLNNWDVSNITNTRSMFAEASSFNGDISGWDVKNVTIMGSMFYKATAFNIDISDWNTESVTNISWMFREAESFDYNLGGWKIGNVGLMDYMLNNSGLSIDNYNATLIGWAQQDNISNNISLGAVGMEYCGDPAIEARDFLVNEKSWNIVGDSECGEEL